MSKTSNFESPHNVVCVTKQCIKDAQGTVQQLTWLCLPEGTDLHAGSTYEMTITADGTITLSPLATLDQPINDQRQQELLDALEQTHQQFGNALRRLAQ